MTGKKETAMQELQTAINNIFGFAGTPQRAQRTIAMAEERRLDNNAMRKARRVADKHGIDIEPDGAGAWWVTHEQLREEEDDPLEGNHFCTTGREVLAAVEIYVNHLESKKP